MVVLRRINFFLTIQYEAIILVFFLAQMALRP